MNRFSHYHSHMIAAILFSLALVLSTAMPVLAAPEAKAVLAPASGTVSHGIVTFSKSAEGITVEYDLKGLKPGRHGFHIHEFGDCTKSDATSAGGHFAPKKNPHGAPTAKEHHAGDMGNIIVPESGSVKGKQTFSALAFEGERSILGRAVVVHSKADDLTSQPAGDAGERVACGVIGFTGS